MYVWRGVRSHQGLGEPLRQRTGSVGMPSISLVGSSTCEPGRRTLSEWVNSVKVSDRKSMQGGEEQLSSFTAR